MPDQLKICMISAGLPTTLCGIADYTAKLLRVLATTPEIELHAITKHNNNVAQIPHVAIHDEVKNWNARELRHVSDIVSTINPHIIHYQHPGKAYGKNLSQFFLPRYLIKKNNIATIVTLHEYTQAPWYAKPWILFLAKTATGVIATNEDDLKRLPTEHKIHIPIGSGIDQSNYTKTELQRRKASLGAEKKFLIGYFGFADRDKGIDHLLLATAELVRRSVPIKLLLITTLDDTHPYHTRLKKLISKLQLQETVVVTGYLPEEEVSVHLSLLDLCVFPFQQSGSLRRSSVVAALAHGVPVLTKQFSSPLARDRENILMYEKQEELAKKIYQALNDPGMADHLRRGALALKTHFDWQNIASKTKDFYQLIAQLNG